MDEGRIDFGLNRVTGPSGAETAARGGVLGIGVPSLRHEAGDDPVEEGAVVESFAGQLQEVVPVLGSLVVQLHNDGAEARLDAHAGARLSLQCRGGEDGNEEQQGGEGAGAEGGNNHRVDFALFVGLQGGCATRPEETSKI